MPADADLLCEFYLSSQLSGGKSVQHNQQNLQRQQQLQRALHQSSSSSFSLETIDFVKYTKNPMSDGLKRKYELLVGNGHHQHQQNNSSSPTTTTTSSSLFSSAVVSTVNGLKTAVAPTSSPTTNGNHTPTSVKVSKSTTTFKCFYLDYNIEKLNPNRMKYL